MQTSRWTTDRRPAWLDQCTEWPEGPSCRARGSGALEGLEQDDMHWLTGSLGRLGGNRLEQSRPTARVGVGWWDQSGGHFGDPRRGTIVAQVQDKSHAQGRPWGNLRHTLGTSQKRH